MTAQYPSETTLSGAGSLLEPKNNTKVEVTADINDLVTTIPTGDTSALATEGYMTFMDGTKEIIYYTGKTLNSLTGVTRGADGSNNTAHLDGAEIEYRVNVGYRTRQNEEIKAISDDLRDIFTVDLDDGVTPASTATDLKVRMDHIATQLALLSGKADWKTAPATTLEAEYTDTNNIKTIDLDETATPATTASSIKDRLDQISNRIIAITGKADWKTNPVKTNEALDTEISNSYNNAPDDTQAPADTAISLEQRVDQIAGGMKAITGESSWKTAPPNNISETNTIITDLAGRVDMLRPTEQGTPDNTVLVSAGHYVSSDGSERVYFAGGNSPAFSVVTADSRIDLLTIDDTGTLGILAGTQSASPVVPSYPTDKQVIAHVLIDETGTVVINTADITDARFFLNLGGGSTGIDYRENYVLGTPKDNYTGSLTTIDLVGSYVIGGKNLRVIYEGVMLTPTVDYTETDANTITMILSVASGKQLSCYWSVATIAGDANSVDGISASATPTANNLLALDSNGKFPATVISELVSFFSYRRPVLVYSGVSTVDIENNTGTADETKIIFPDGDSRSVVENPVSQYRRFDITATASLTATHDSGLRSGESEASDTWYALYAVKTTDDATKFVIVGTVTLPLQANYTTLNGYFGTDGWVYLGLIRNGAISTQATNICKFVMCGNEIKLYEVQDTANIAGSRDSYGIRIAHGASVSSLVYTYSAGTGSTSIPNNIGMCDWIGITTAVSRELQIGDQNINVGSSNSVCIAVLGDTSVIGFQSYAWRNASDLGAGIGNSGATAGAHSILLRGWTDKALGIGSNPLI
jgi:hypothetical protein